MQKWQTYISCTIGFLFPGIGIPLFANEPEHRKFNPEHIEKLRNNSDYDYSESMQFSFWEWLSNLLEKIGRWLSGKMQLNPSPNIEAAPNVLIWTIAIILVAALLYLILKGKWGWILTGKNFGKKDNAYSVYEEDIHSINYADEIETAVNQGQYRYATRLFYLRSLKLMSDNQIIDWRLNKTNTDYRREIKDPATRKEFDNLSITFEYVWYGEFEPSSDSFHHTFEQFRRFNAQFKTTEAS